MDLKFIWIKEHRAIKDFNFNFCHDDSHQFHYDGKTLKLIDNKKSPIKFSNKVSGLTAIAGKNGAGKSSFGEAVLNATATLQENSFGMDYTFHGIVIFERKVYVHIELPVENEKELEQKGYSLIKFKDSPFEKELTRRRKDDEFLGQLGFIYFSNNFDFKSYIEGNNLTNISTSFRMYNDHFYNSYCLVSELEINGKKKGDCQNQLNIFHSQEHYRILKFLLLNPEFIDFAKENMLMSVFSSYSGNNKFLNYQYPKDETTEYLEEIEQGIFDEIFNYYPEKSEYIGVDPNIFRLLIHKLYKLNFLIALKDKKEFTSDQVSDFIYLGKIPISLSETEIEKLLLAHSSLLENAHFDSKYYVSDILSSERQCKDWRFEPISRFYIYFTEENKANLKTLINLELEILSSGELVSKRFSNFSLFSYFSSGELSILSMYSRIFEVIQGYKAGIFNKTELILFLDEPESGYHPNWSREFIKRISTFLAKDFNPYYIQLIITTHSPYILSDLPNENIRLINKNYEESPEITESKTNTFGANIYDLMNDSFFMSDGFIGTFAQDKIDKVFSELTKKLNDPKYVTSITQEYIQSIIEIIGEPLIQRQLSSLYDRVFHEDLEVEIIDRQMEALKKMKERKLKGKQ